MSCTNHRRETPRETRVLSDFDDHGDASSLLSREDDGFQEWAALEAAREEREGASDFFLPPESKGTGTATDPDPFKGLRPYDPKRDKGTPVVPKPASFLGAGGVYKAPEVKMHEKTYDNGKLFKDEGDRPHSWARDSLGSLTHNRADERRPGETAPRTSVSYPIYVDWYDAPALGGARGRLGMTFAPGKKDKGNTATWDRDLDLDMERLRKVERVTTVVCLLQDHELVQLKIQDIVAVGAEHGVNVLRFPVPDVSTPDSLREARLFAQRIVRDLKRGHRVVFHCRAGLGRAGMLAAAVLIEMGWSPDSAAALTRATRKGTIQTASQERFLVDYAAKRIHSNERL